MDGSQVHWLSIYDYIDLGVQCHLIGWLFLQGPHGLWKFEKSGIRFSRPWISVKTVCEFCGLQSAREKPSAYHLPFPKNEQLQIIKTLLCKITKNALPISFVWQSALAIGCSKGCAPLPDVQKSCVPLCCFSTPYCRHHAWYCEKFVNFEMIFLYRPCLYKLLRVCVRLWINDIWRDVGKEAPSSGPERSASMSRV